MRRYPDLVFALGAALFSLALFLYLPSLGLAVYASPDETATAVAAERLSQAGSAQVGEPLATSFPWLHPRSWVSQGEAIVPVGFLGWPWMLSWVVKVFGAGVLPWMGAAVLASCAIPLFYLFRRFGQWQALGGTLVALAMPNMVLYGNRGLFSNAPLVALVVWAMWLTFLATQHKKSWLALLAGLAWALALAIRPVEVVWILPWLAWSVYAAGWKKREGLMAVAAALIVLFLVELAVHATYGRWFVIGYWLRDNPLTLVRQVYAPVLSAARLTPFGIHPMNILRNSAGFLGGLLAPWTVLGLAALAVALMRFRQKLPPIVWLCLGTTAWLIVFYGNGRYLDHVSPDAITVGNSFIRYLLPLSPLIGLSFAWLARDVLVGRGARLVLVAMAVALMLGGVHRAFIADDEGVWYTRRELMRYDLIRHSAAETLGPGAVVFSDRSDKIFFPFMRGVSPQPSIEDMAKLVTTRDQPAGLFSRPISQEGRDAWLTYGVEVQDLDSFGRERLYRLVPRP